MCNIRVLNSETTVLGGSPSPSSGMVVVFQPGTCLRPMGTYQNALLFHTRVDPTVVARCSTTEDQQKTEILQPLGGVTRDRKPIFKEAVVRFAASAALSLCFSSLESPPLAHATPCNLHSLAISSALTPLQTTFQKVANPSIILSESSNGCVADEGAAFNTLSTPQNNVEEISNEYIVAEAWQVINDRFLDARSHKWSREAWLRKREEIFKRPIPSRMAAHEIIKNMLAELKDPYTRFITPAEIRHQGCKNAQFLSVKRMQSIQTPVYFRLEHRGDDLIGYIRLKEFNAVARRHLVIAMDKLKAAGATSFVLDLRDNPGGLVQAGIETARLFLDNGDTVVYTAARNPEDQKSILAKNPPLTRAPLMILVNEHTASASEIVAAALHDNCRAVLVGHKTFGKGLIQSVYELSDGSGVIATVGKYVTPRLEEIDKKGIIPDFQELPSSNDVKKKIQSCSAPNMKVVHTESN